MDYLKNTLEETIIKEVEDAFKTHPEVCGCLQCRKDVTVFVLNNIKPRYIISTRGMLHESSNAEEASKIINEIRDLIPQGMQRVNDNKRPNFEHNDEEGDLHEMLGKTERFTMTGEHYFNFPFFIGSVQDADTKAKLSEVEVTLTANEDIINGWDANWPNPYYTSEKSGGKFAFWPRALPSSEPDGNTSINFKFVLVIKKEGYEELQENFEIKMEPQKYIINFIRKDYTKDMGDIDLKKK